MGDFCKGVAYGMVAGVCVGAIIVAKNKKLANQIKSKMQTAETKLMDAKEMIEEKFQEAQEQSESSGQMSTETAGGKKSKN